MPISYNCTTWVNGKGLLPLQAEPCRHMSATMAWRSWRHWALHYLYGHRCMIFTDHKEVQSLLNSSSLTEIGKVGFGVTGAWLTDSAPAREACNANADVLSRFPPSAAVDSRLQTVVAAVTDTSGPAKNGEPNRTLAERQTADLGMLGDWTLLWDEAQAQCVVQTHRHYALVDDLLSIWNQSRPSVSFSLPQTEKSCFLKCAGTPLVGTCVMARFTASSHLAICGQVWEII